MNRNSAAQRHTPTRRQLLSGMAVGLATLATTRSLFASSAAQTVPSKPESDHRTALHQEIAIKARPQRIYEALLNSKQFAMFSGLPAEIDPKVGGAFSMFGGQIVGRNIELVPDQRIVQAWRPAHWDPGVYSMAKFDLKANDSGTTITLDHTGFPEGDFASLDSGWFSHYWEPLKKFVA